MYPQPRRRPTSKGVYVREGKGRMRFDSAVGCVRMPMPITNSRWHKLSRPSIAKAKHRGERTLFRSMHDATAVNTTSPAGLDDAYRYAQVSAPEEHS